MRQAVTVVVMCGLLLAGSVAARQKPQDVALQAAMRTETVTGDLKGAIAQYQEIFSTYHKTDRGVAATALVRMAECHHRLGEQQAERLFERVLKEFGDQKAAVEIATARLGRAKGSIASTGMINRQVWTGRTVDPVGNDFSGWAFIVRHRLGHRRSGAPRYDHRNDPAADQQGKLDRIRRFRGVQYHVTAHRWLTPGST
jgi:hypothetical protein